MKFSELIEKVVVSDGILGIKLQADNDFYSQVKRLQDAQLPLISSSLLTLTRFSCCPKDDDGNIEIVKTGMGSSAALTTSLVGSLLQYFDVVDISAPDELNGVFGKSKRIVHNLAQLAHPIAQGKIGSGFDVASAVYGIVSN